MTVRFIGDKNPTKRKESHRQATSRRQSSSHDFCCKVVLVKHIAEILHKLDVKRQFINLIAENI